MQSVLLYAKLILILVRCGDVFTLKIYTSNQHVKASGMWLTASHLTHSHVSFSAIVCCFPVRGRWWPMKMKTALKSSRLNIHLFPYIRLLTPTCGYCSIACSKMVKINNAWEKVSSCVTHVVNWDFSSKAFVCFSM